MDTSNPAVFVNAELLRMYVGRRVRTVVQVIRTDSSGVVGKSSDDQQIVVKGQLPSPLTTFVEIIGIADGVHSIRAEIGTNFGDSFECIWIYGRGPTPSGMAMMRMLCSSPDGRIGYVLQVELNIRQQPGVQPHTQQRGGYRSLRGGSSSSGRRDSGRRRSRYNPY